MVPDHAHAVAPRAVRVRHALIAVAASTALLALLAGCGSYTRADFIARADAICASTLRAERTIAAPRFTPGAAGQLSTLAAYLSRAAPLVQSQSGQLRALPRPSEDARDRALLTRYLAASARAAGDYAALAAAAQRNDAREVLAAEAALRSSPTTALAITYGLRTCGGAGATVR